MTTGSTQSPRAATRLPRALVGALCLAAAGSVVALAVAVVDARSSGGPAAPVEVSAEASGRDDRGAVRVLRRWDDARARAWARADTSALRRLYTSGSEAGRRDVAMLRRWRERGLRVTGMGTQVLSARVLYHGARRIVLEVTDRLVGAVAAGRGHRAALPSDGFSTRRITLRKVSGAWRVAATLPVGSGR